MTIAPSHECLRFRRDLRVLTNIDASEFPGPTHDWPLFQQMPHHYFLECDDCVAGALWRIIERLPRPLSYPGGAARIPPGSAGCPSETAAGRLPVGVGPGAQPTTDIDIEVICRDIAESALARICAPTPVGESWSANARRIITEAVEAARAAGELDGRADGVREGQHHPTDAIAVMINGILLAPMTRDEAAA